MNTYIVHIEPLGDFYVNAGTNAEAHSKAWNSLTPAQRDEIDWSAVSSAQPEDVELLSADPDCLHWVKRAPGGGIRCVRCSGWFCF
jgi:hypothetical protein